MTVGELKKALRGLPNDMIVMCADHDHAEWETNGTPSSAGVVNQKYMSDYAHQELEKNDGVFKIKGDYFLLHI